MLLVNNDLPVKTAQELVALAKSKPGELTFASTGIGTPGHLNGELFSRLAGIKAVHVPYRVVGQAVTDIVAGRISFWIAPIPTMLQNVRQGQLRPLAVAGDERSADLPGIPTVKETGIGDFDASTTYAVFAPAGTPKDVVDKLHAEIKRALDDERCSRSCARPAWSRGRARPRTSRGCCSAHPAMGRRDQERGIRSTERRPRRKSARVLCHRHRYRRHLHRPRRLRCRNRRGRLHQEPDDLRAVGRGDLRLHPQGRARGARGELRQARHHARHQRAAAARRRPHRAARPPRASATCWRSGAAIARSRSTCASTASRRWSRASCASRSRSASTAPGGCARRSPGALGALADALQRNKVEALAISFLNSYLDAGA